MSYGRITHPSEAVQTGDEITVKVLKFDKDKERISLGLKQVAPDPWDHVQQTYVPGLRVIGSRSQRYGLRSIRRTRARRRRSDPHFGNDLEPPHEAPVQGR